MLKLLGLSSFSQPRSNVSPNARMSLVSEAVSVPAVVDAVTLAEQNSSGKLSAQPASNLYGLLRGPAVSNICQHYQ